MKYQYRSLFISDVHLGTAHCKAAQLLDFLREVDTETLYLVGDIVDLVSMRRKLVWNQTQTKVVSALLKKVESGTRVIFIPGNHDHWFRDMAGAELMGVEIHRSVHYTSADGRQYYVTHGDEFDVVLRHGPLIRLFGSALYAVLMIVNQINDSVRNLLGLPYWSLSSHVKQRSKKAHAFVKDYQAAALQRAEELGLDGTICGHIHQAAIIENGDARRYCNSGDWVEHCSALAEDHNGQFSIIDWRLGATRNDPSCASVKPLTKQHSSEVAALPDRKEAA